MQIITNTLDTYTYHELADILHSYNNTAAVSDFLFFDIKTTGFSARNSMCYLIGCVSLNNENFIIKQFFADNDIKLLLGLRNHFKLPSELGGKYDASVDGPYPLEGLEKDYYIKNEDGSLFTVAKAKYPTGGITRGNVGLVDGTNPDALEWYRQGAALWGVDGFKEDAMISQSTYHDGNWNLLLANMVNKDCLLYTSDAADD